MSEALSVPAKEMGIASFKETADLPLILGPGHLTIPSDRSIGYFFTHENERRAYIQKYLDIIRDITPDLNIDFKEFLGQLAGSGSYFFDNTGQLVKSISFKIPFLQKQLTG